MIKQYERVNLILTFHLSTLFPTYIVNLNEEENPWCKVFRAMVWLVHRILLTLSYQSLSSIHNVTITMKLYRHNWLWRNVKLTMPQSPSFRAAKCNHEWIPLRTRSALVKPWPSSLPLEYSSQIFWNSAATSSSQSRSSSSRSKSMTATSPVWWI